MQEPLATVQSIYEAFGKGDVPGILAHLADDVAWESWDNNFAQQASVPWLAVRRGKAEAVEFFKIVGAFKISDFRVLSLMAGGNQVAAEILIEADVPSGGHLRDEEMHLWTFDEQGKVVRFRHYCDTAKHIAAAQGPAT